MCPRGSRGQASTDNGDKCDILTTPGDENWGSGDISHYTNPVPPGILTTVTSSNPRTPAMMSFIDNITRLLEGKYFHAEMYFVIKLE